jgi:hypothetical protein
MMSFPFRISKVSIIGFILIFVRILRPQIKCIYRGTTQTLSGTFHTLHSMFLDVRVKLNSVVPTTSMTNLCPT